MKMSKKENDESLEVSQGLEVSETIVSDDQFDLTVLKKDIENHEREVKNAVNQTIIDKANFQQETENLQQESERLETFQDAIKELLEFIFSFVNRPLERVDVSKFDAKFTDELTEKIMKLVPKDQMDVVQKFVGLGNKSNSAIQVLKIMKFFMFLSQELFKRFDEYNMYRKTHDKPKMKISLPKKDKPEA
jgi:seryl-tRNA synthetase